MPSEICQKVVSLDLRTALKDQLSSRPPVVLWNWIPYQKQGQIFKYCSRKTLKEEGSFRGQVGSLKLWNVDVYFPSFGQSVSDHWSLRSPSSCPLAFFLYEFFGVDLIWFLVIFQTYRMRTEMT